MLYSKHEAEMVAGLKLAHKLGEPIEGLVGWDHSHRSSSSEQQQQQQGQ
eukprot:COSAG06_NODE_221_length_19912_cov_17.460875_3_plen_49_part_00